ncbi:MAG: alkaline phosphatase family protein [Bacteroidales bacterium]|nr:alkaline phosphatase family protein [Bacteroidales bacterium]
MNIKKNFLTCLIIFSTIYADAQRIPSEKPKLIVGITISGMRYDYLSSYWEQFSGRGFKRLAGTGTFCKNAAFDQLITESAVGYATISTGSRSDAHGIVADYWYERISREVTYCVSDPDAYNVLFDDENGHVSPRNMLSRTLSDEMRITSQFKSKVIGVGMDPKAPVLLSGHTANAAYWFDSKYGKWTTSTYYTDSLPSWVKEINDKNYKDIYKDKIWETLLPENEYTASMPDSNAYEIGFDGRIEFPYDLKKIKDVSGEKDYTILKYTPFGNTYTKDMAIAAIVSEELGLDEKTDWINISFNSGMFLSERFSTWSVEIQDMYLRLDQDLGHLLEFLDDQVGLENTLIFLTSDHAYADDPEILAQHRVPSGFFNYYSTISLLKSYLNAIYGQGEWITFYYANQVYLNHQLIEDSRLSLQEMQDRVASFLIQFSGISNALPSYILLRNNFTEGVYSRIQHSYNQKRSGDVMIYLTPGWIEKGSEYRESLSNFHYDAHVPLVFYGWKINRITIPERVTPLDIVPTIAYYLGISAPENSTGNVITGMVR